MKGQKSNVFLSGETEYLFRHQAPVSNPWYLHLPHEIMKYYTLKADRKTVCVTAGRGPGAGSMGLKGHPKGAFSGGEIQRLRRLRHEAHTPNVLVAVSD